MVLGLVVCCEVMFWVFILSGLLVRYLLKRRRLGMALLAMSPVVDVVLLAATAVDLQGGGEATFAHVLAAIYLGVSLVYGNKMVAWADAQFSYRFADGPGPEKKAKSGSAHASDERSGWFRHVVAFAIGCGIMAGLALFSGNPQVSETFIKAAGTWGIILGIDFAISFSYTLFPKKREARVRFLVCRKLWMKRKGSARSPRLSGRLLRQRGFIGQRFDGSPIKPASQSGR